MRLLKLDSMVSEESFKEFFDRLLAMETTSVQDRFIV